MRLFIISIYTVFLLIISPPSLSAYTTMTLEGVKQANGVWTASGVMDSMGFVRTTGSVTISGHTASTAVALAVERNIAKNTFRNVVSKMGPYGIAAVGAYEVYDWFAAGDGAQGELVPCDASQAAWCYPAPPYDNSYTYGKYYGITSGQTEFRGSTPSEVCDARALAGGVSRVSSIDTVAMRCIFVSLTTGAYTGYAQYYPADCRAGMTVSSCVNQTDPSKKPVPITSDYFNSLPDPSLPVMADGFNNIPALRDGGIPISSTKFNPYSEWLGDPYFKDGQWWRDRMDVSPSPAPGQPTRVRVDVGPVKIVGATNPETTPDTGPAGGTGGAPQPEKEKPSFCEANPGSIACQEMGSLEQEPFDPIEKPFQITPQNPWGSGDAQCPAPKVMSLSTGSTVTLSYQPACDFFRGVRPAVLALALLAALYIALGIPVGKGD